MNRSIWHRVVREIMMRNVERGEGSRKAKGIGVNRNRRQQRNCYMENGIKTRRTGNTYLHNVHGRGGREKGWGSREG